MHQARFPQAFDGVVISTQSFGGVGAGRGRRFWPRLARKFRWRQGLQSPASPLLCYAQTTAWSSDRKALHRDTPPTTKHIAGVFVRSPDLCNRETAAITNRDRTGNESRSLSFRRLSY
jgi:hypothetical protein